MALPGEPGADPYNARMDEQGLQTAELLKIETMADSPMVSPSESPYTTDSASSRIHPFRSPTTPFWQRPPLEEETDPTSIAPSELSDDLDRKQTESPADSNNAVHGANYSIHSRSSGSYSDRSEARERAVPAAVNADRVKAIGVQFAEESSAEGVSVARFHDPENDVEARYIRDKIRQANARIDDMDAHASRHFLDPGSTYQVSARPQGYTEPCRGIDNALGLPCKPSPLGKKGSSVDPDDHALVAPPNWPEPTRIHGDDSIPRPPPPRQTTVLPIHRNGHRLESLSARLPIPPMYIEQKPDVERARRRKRKRSCCCIIL